MSATLDLDARRLLCPMPVIRLQDYLKRQTAGTRVRVTCTDPGTQQDIPTWCRINHHQVISSHIIDDEYVFLVKKGVDDS